MTDRETPRLLTFESRTRGWIKRSLVLTVGAALVMLAFFFITLAIVVGALLAAIIGVRVWWFMRRLNAARKADAPLEGTYAVIDHGDSRAAAEQADLPSDRLRR